MILESRFPGYESGNHSLRVARYAWLIGCAAGLDDPAVDRLYHAALVHDIGKIAIPDRVLAKPGPLDAIEWRLIKKHPDIGSAILGGDDRGWLAEARQVAETHHERWDGSGYPNGLSGSDIPIAGRIVAIADCFDAMASDRPYKRSMEFEAAVGAIHRGAGQQFDPELVRVFAEVVPAFRELFAHHSIL